MILFGIIGNTDMMNVYYEKHKRLEYIDIYKGVAIILIISHHVFQYFPVWVPIKNYITDFHVGMFLFASGYMKALKTKKKIEVKRAIMYKGQKLMVPYIFFSLINAILKIGVLFVSNKLTIAVIKDEFIEIVTIGNGPIWFLYRMFLVELAFILVNKLSVVYGEKVIYFVAILSLSITILLQANKNQVIVVVCSLSLCLFEVILGYVFKILMDRSVKFMRQKIRWAFCFVLLGTFISLMGNVELNYKMGHYSNLILYVLVSFMLPAGYLLLIEKITEEVRSSKVKELIEYYGANSLIVLGVHPILLLCFSYPFADIVCDMQAGYQIIIGLLVWFIIITFEVPFIRFINKYVPALGGKVVNKNIL